MFKRLLRRVRKEKRAPRPTPSAKDPVASGGAGPLGEPEAAAGTTSAAVPPESTQPSHAAAQGTPGANAPAPAVRETTPTTEVLDAAGGTEASTPLEQRAQALIRRYAAEGNDVAMVLRQVSKMTDDLPQPPLAAQAVLRVLNRVDYDLDELVKHLERDPAICQTLLRHANSPYYGAGLAEPVVSIRRAIQQVGATGVHAAVMQHFVSGEFLRPGPKLEGMARLIWQHMVRTAPLARGLAKPMGADPDKAFTAALLHDVGKLAFLDHVGRERRRLRRELEITPGFVSVALNVLHEPLGQAASTAWGLPDYFAETIGGHHRYDPPEEPHLLSEVVFLAEALDLIRFRGGTPNFEGLWHIGHLTGPREAVEAWLEQHPDL